MMAGRKKCVCGCNKAQTFALCRPCWHHIPQELRNECTKAKGRAVRIVALRGCFRWIKDNPRPNRRTPKP